jgi:hypothetical protein
MTRGVGVQGGRIGERQQEASSREHKTLRISKKTRHHGELNRKNSMRKKSAIKAPTSRAAHR